MSRARKLIDSIDEAPVKKIVPARLVTLGKNGMEIQWSEIPDKEIDRFNKLMSDIKNKVIALWYEDSNRGRGGRIKISDKRSYQELADLTKEIRTVGKITPSIGIMFGPGRGDTTGKSKSASTLGIRL